MKKLLGGLALVLVVVFLWIGWRRGVRVHVENTGATPLADVVVKVRGAEYPLGTLDAGESDVVKVHPTSASDVQVTWTTPDGRKGYGRVDCSLEPGGSHGHVRFTLDGIGVREGTADVRVGFF